MELAIGQRVTVTDALGQVREKRALSGVSDGEKPTFLACGEDEWVAAEGEGREPEPDPFAWPVTSIRQD